MKSEVAVREFLPTEWQEYRAIRLRALAESPDAFGSTFDRESQQPDAAWSEHLAAGAASARELPLVAETAANAVGLAWARVDASDPQLAHLHQMWVDPGFRGAGVGRALLQAAIAWAERLGARSLCLTATCGATPAARLYAWAGFVPVADPEPIRPGSEVLAQALRLELNAVLGGERSSDA